MIKKLRFRFVIVTMISVIAVLGTIISVINIMNYSKVRQSADSILDMLSENNGEFTNRDPLKPDGIEPPNHRVNEETPFETRYFTITLYSNGTTAINTSQIAAINEQQALQMAEAVRNNSRGYKGVYRYKVTNYEDKSLVIFMDCTKQLDTAQSFLFYSIIISMVGVVGVFLLVFFLSKKIVLPIALSYERQKRFITNAGHELKTPLTIISANNEMIEIEYGENEFSNSISKQVNRMTSMVKNLTMLAKLDEQNLKNTVSFNLSDATMDCIEAFKSAFKTKNIDFKYEIDEFVQYHGDEGLIRQLLQLVLDNALKYSVCFANVELKRNVNKVSITISNDAIDVKPGCLNQCFERFYRSTSSRASLIEGSGIGLSIAKEIVDLHKGDISAVGLENNIFLIKIIL